MNVYLKKIKVEKLSMIVTVALPQLPLFLGAIAGSVSRREKECLLCSCVHYTSCLQTDPCTCVASSIRISQSGSDCWNEVENNATYCSAMHCAGEGVGNK